MPNLRADFPDWRHARRLAGEVRAESIRLNLGILAAGLGLLGLLALFPALGLIVTLWSLLADPAVIQGLAGNVAGLLPDAVRGLLQEQLATMIRTAQERSFSLATFVSVAIAVWSASSGMTSILSAFNAIFGVPNREGWLYRIAVSALLTFALCVVGLVVIAALLIAPVVLALVPLGPFATIAIEVLRWMIAMAAVGGAMAMMYRHGPNLSPPPAEWITPGAAIATLMWFAASVGLSVYLANFADYDKVYGSLGAAMALLIWSYLSAYALLLGAALNAAIRRSLMEEEKGNRVARPPSSAPSEGPRPSVT